jgi:hypothetical protein
MLKKSASHRTNTVRFYSSEESKISKHLESEITMVITRACGKLLSNRHRVSTMPDKKRKHKYLF